MMGDGGLAAVNITFASGFLPFCDMIKLLAGAVALALLAACTANTPEPGTDTVAAQCDP